MANDSISPAIFPGTVSTTTGTVKVDNSCRMAKHDELSKRPPQHNGKLAWWLRFARSKSLLAPVIPTKPPLATVTIGLLHPATRG